MQSWSEKTPLIRLEYILVYLENLEYHLVTLNAPEQSQELQMLAPSTNS